MLISRIEYRGCVFLRDAFLFALLLFLRGDINYQGRYAYEHSLFSGEPYPLFVHDNGSRAAHASQKWIYKAKCREIDTMRLSGLSAVLNADILRRRFTRGLHQGSSPRRINLTFFSPRDAISADIVSFCSIIYETIMLVFRRRDGLFPAAPEK